MVFTSLTFTMENSGLSSDVLADKDLSCPEANRSYHRPVSSADPFERCCNLQTLVHPNCYRS